MVSLKFLTASRGFELYTEEFIIVLSAQASKWNKKKELCFGHI